MTDQPVLERATQGHVYGWLNEKVLALDSGPTPTVAIIDPVVGWLQHLRFRVYASDLTPLPMVYFHGQTPR